MVVYHNEGETNPPTTAGLETVFKEVPPDTARILTKRTEPPNDIMEEDHSHAGQDGLRVLSHQRV